jgi:ketosteroid isomerase-like protein
MSQENVELVRRGLDAFNRRDLSAYLALIDADVGSRVVAERGWRAITRATRESADMDRQRGHRRCPRCRWVRPLQLERLRQHCLAALYDGDRRAGERDVGDLRRPVAVRAARLRGRRLRRRARGHVEGDVAVLDLGLWSTCTPVSVTWAGFWPGACVPPLFVQVALGVPVAVNVIVTSPLPSPARAPLALSVRP